MVLIKLNRDCRGFSTLALIGASMILIILFFAAGKKIVQSGRSSKVLSTKGEVETLRDSVLMILNDPNFCKKSLRNAPYPSGIVAKFSPTVAISTSSQLNALVLGTQNIIQNGTPFSRLYDSVTMTLSETDPLARTAPSTTTTRFLANLKISLRSNSNLGLKSEVLDFPIYVTTDTSASNTIPDHEIQDCGTPRGLATQPESLRQVLLNPAQCAQSMKNANIPMAGRAKFSPTVVLPTADQLAEVSTSVTPYLKAGLPFGTDYIISKVSLVESDPTARTALSTDRTRFIASLRLELQPAQTNGFVPMVATTKAYPFWIVTDTNSANAITDHEIQECGLLEFGSVNFSTVGTSTWVVPEGIDVIKIEVWGSGGGGGGARWTSTAACGGGGGGGGGYMEATVNVIPGSTLTLTIGAGGTGGIRGSGTSLAAGNAGNGTAGTVTSVGGLLSVQGGAGGLGCRYNSTTGKYVPGDGARGGCFTTGACSCTDCLSHYFIVGGMGAYGEFNSTSSKSAYGGAGGDAPLGGNGAPHNLDISSSVQPGKFPGGGGGGGSRQADTVGARPGSNGANGRILISY